MNEPKQLVYTDAGRFSQVLINLLSNSIKFSDHGHVVVKVSSDDTDDGQKTHLNIEVQEYSFFSGKN